MKTRILENIFLLLRYRLLLPLFWGYRSSVRFLGQIERNDDNGLLPLRRFFGTALPKR